MTNITSILSTFPQFELSYETMSHKKVFDSDIILAIPDGAKVFAWFTTFNDENVCCVIDFYKKNIYIVTTCFNDSLSIGTIFFGTSFKHNNIHYFCVEDI